MDAAREVAELLQRGARRLARLGQVLRRLLGILLQLLLGQAEVHAERDEPRLRAVVQVALDAPQLGLGRLDRAGAGLRQLLHARLVLLAARDRFQPERQRDHSDRPDGPERPASRCRPDADEEQREQDSLAYAPGPAALRFARPPGRSDGERGRKPDPDRPERAAAARRPDDEDEEVDEEEGPGRSPDRLPKQRQRDHGVHSRSRALGRKVQPRQPVERARQPPVALAEQRHRRRQQERPDHGRVDQHRDGEAEAHLLERQQPERGEDREHADHHHRRRSSPSRR